MVRSKEREIQVNLNNLIRVYLFIYVSTECVTISESARSSPEAVQRPADQGRSRHTLLLVHVLAGKLDGKNTINFGSVAESSAV